VEHLTDKNTFWNGRKSFTIRRIAAYVQYTDSLLKRSFLVKKISKISPEWCQQRSEPGFSARKCLVRISWSQPRRNKVRILWWRSGLCELACVGLQRFELGIPVHTSKRRLEHQCIKDDVDYWLSWAVFYLTSQWWNVAKNLKW